MTKGVLRGIFSSFKFFECLFRNIYFFGLYDLKEKYLIIDTVKIIYILIVKNTSVFKT